MNSSENIQNQYTDVFFGNDIVDLDDIDSVNPQERFLMRVFTRGEYIALESRNFDLSAVWSLWACKEAAFKAVSSAFPGTNFRWKQFEADLNRGTVRYKEHELSIHLIVDSNCIHAALSGKLECGRLVKSSAVEIASVIAENSEMKALFEKNRLDYAMTESSAKKESAPYFRESLPAEKSDQKFISLRELLERNYNESAGIRFFGIKCISQMKGLSEDEILVTDTDLKPIPPEFFSIQENRIIPASFSHHGNFLAVSFL